MSASCIAGQTMAWDGTPVIFTIRPRFEAEHADPHSCIERSVREPLGSYGSCHPGRQACWTEAVHFQCVNIWGYLSVIPRQHTRAFFVFRSRVYFLRIQPIK